MYRSQVGNRNIFFSVVPAAGAAVSPLVGPEAPVTLEAATVVEAGKNFAIRFIVEKQSIAARFNIASIDVPCYARATECACAYVVCE